MVRNNMNIINDRINFYKKGDKMKFPYQIILIIVAIFMGLQCCENDKIRIYLIGDSTMADKPVDGNPERGWGQMLPEFFTENVSIINHAVNGRSTKSFIDEGRWQAVFDTLEPGDYVMIQFGHNDQKDYDTTRYTAPNGAYKLNLVKFVQDSRAKKAIPILLTSIMRRRFDEKGQFYDTHGEYPEVVRHIADSMNVPLIDMHKLSRELIISKGEEGSKDIFLWVEPGKYAKFPEGKKDNTHFCENGARQMAKLTIHDLETQNLDLTNYVIN